MATIPASITAAIATAIASRSAAFARIARVAFGDASLTGSTAVRLSRALAAIANAVVAFAAAATTIIAAVIAIVAASTVIASAAAITAAAVAAGPAVVAGATGARPIGQAALLELAARINRRVNFSVSQLSDPENYGVAGYWTLPANGSGDCEDFVLQKYKLLLDAGVDSRELSIAVVLDRHGDNHAVLVLRHGSGDLVLDSLTRSIQPWNRTGYTFLAMQSRDNKTQWEVVMNQPRDSNVLAQY